MSQKKIVDLHFPVLGLDRRGAYQDQGQYTTPDCLNVRPRSTLEGRESGGSRPGIDKAFYEQLGSGAKVNMLAQVNCVKTDKFTIWSDSFYGDALGSIWSAVAGWYGASALSVTEDSFTGAATSTTRAGAIRSVLSLFDTSQVYWLEMFIVPYQGQHQGRYSFFIRMDGTNVSNDSTEVELDLSTSGVSGAYSGRFREYTGGAPTDTAFSSGDIGSVRPGWFRVKVNGNTVTAYWQGNNLGSITAHAAAGTQFGIGMNCTKTSGLCLVDLFRIQYYETVNLQNLQRVLVAASGNTLYRESPVGQLVAVANVSSTNLASNRTLLAADRGQILYIADNDHPRVARTTGSIVSGVLDDANVSSWTALGITTATDKVYIVSDSGASATLGVFDITSIDATNGLTLATTGGVSPAATNSSGSVTYRVERAPKQYNPVTDTLSKWTPTTGFIPLGCQAIASYRDRIVLAMQPSDPQMWYMSRSGDANDFDYGASDPLRAIAGNNADAGKVGDPITALIAHGDDTLIFGCDASLWMLRGDPCYGGQIDNVSRSYGVVDKTAWCKGPSGETIFLSRDGLFVISPNGTEPQSLSRERLPRELIDVNRSLYTVLLAFDQRNRGVHIYLSPNDNKDQIHWWFDYQTKGFFPVDLADNHEPFSILQYFAPFAEDSCVLLGTRNGYVRRYRDTAETDEGTEISAYVYYSPLPSGGMRDTILNQFSADLATNSGQMTWKIYSANTAEAALASTTVRSTGTWSGGNNRWQYPRVRGSALALKLQQKSSSLRAWRLEGLKAQMQTGGKDRGAG